MISTTPLVYAQYDQSTLNTTSREERPQQTADRAANTTNTHLDRALEHQLLLHEKIRNNPGLTQTTKERALTTMDIHVRRLQQIRAQGGAAESEMDVLSIRRQAREEWGNYQKAHFQYRGLHIAGRAQDILHRLQNIANSFKTRINQNEILQTSDLASINAALISFDSASANAQDSINEAISVFTTINEEMTTEEAQTTFQTGMQSLQNARSHLREANMHLRTAMMHAYTLLSTHTDAIQE